MWVAKMNQERTCTEGTGIQTVSYLKALVTSTNQMTEGKSEGFICPERIDTVMRGFGTWAGPIGILKC